MNKHVSENICLPLLNNYSHTSTNKWAILKKHPVVVIEPLNIAELIEMK